MGNRLKYTFKIARRFWRECSRIRNIKAIEIGTCRINPDVSSVHTGLLPADARTIRVDMRNGKDVDVVWDAHKLSERFGEEFDVGISVATWEHLERPWIAAMELGKAVKPGGLIYIESHQTFPVHSEKGYKDYWRFTVEALELIFKDANFEIVEGAYLWPCRIFCDTTPEVEGIEDCPAYLGVAIHGKKK